MNKIFSKVKKYFYFTTDETHSLVEKARKGDQRSVTKLFNKFKPIMYKKIKNSTIVDLSPEEMEDEVLIFLTRIFTKELDKFDKDKASFGSWLTHCFNNHILGIPRRKRKVYTTGLDDMSKNGKDGDTIEWNIKDTTFQIEKYTDRVPFITIVRMLYTVLDSTEVRLIVDRYFYGFTEKEAEIRAGVTARTCNQRIKRAMKKLHKKVDKRWFDLV
jgi:RNA polymerase sigma factor (sigma-70 family)